MVKSVIKHLSKAWFQAFSCSFSKFRMIAAVFGPEGSCVEGSVLYEKPLAY